MLPASVSTVALMLLRVIALRASASMDEPTAVSLPVLDPAHAIELARPAQPEPVAWWPRPSKTRSPEVRFLVHDAAQCQARGDLVAAALRVNELVTLCPQARPFVEWLASLRRRVDLEHERDRAVRETGCETVALSKETVERIVELSRGHERPTPAACEELLCSLAALDEIRRDESFVEAVDASTLRNSLVAVAR